MQFLLVLRQPKALFQKHNLHLLYKRVRRKPKPKISHVTLLPQCKNILKAQPRRALDLFSGTGAVARTLESLGWEVVTLDWNPKAQAQVVEDILRWDYTQYPPKFFDLIAAGVPCEEYSRAKTTAPRNFAKADSIVQRTLKVIKYFAPTLWWIENPRWGELRNRKLMDGVGYVDVDYCCFSDWGYKKPTRIWGSSQIASLEDKLCQKRNCPHVGENGQHKLRLGGNEMKVGTWLKGRMPENLVIYLVSAESSFGIRFLESQGNPSQVQPGMNPSSKILVVENQSQVQPGMNPSSKILVAEEPQRGVSSGRPTSVSQAGYTVVKETPTNRLLQGVSEGVQRRLSVGRSTSGSTHGQPVAKEPEEHQQNVFTGRSTSGFTGEHNTLEGF